MGQNGSFVSFPPQSLMAGFSALATRSTSAWSDAGQNPRTYPLSDGVPTKWLVSGECLAVQLEDSKQAPRLPR